VAGVLTALVRQRAGPLALVVVTAGACAGGGDDGGDAATGPEARRATNLALTSPAFDDGEEIPDGFTCDGANATPPLEWTGVPHGTAELVLLVEDPDAPTETPFVHWVVWGVDPSLTGFPEEAPPAGIAQGTNGTGGLGYLGPCPPPADDAHRYSFTLLALSEPLDLAAGATADDVRSASVDVTLGEAQLTGTYAR
jgi:Raf kinase inhibitor-like YbhB/YbcL family protein